MLEAEPLRLGLGAAAVVTQSTGGGQYAVQGMMIRQRSAVSKRLRAVLRQISGVDPKLGRYLNLTIRTGNFCSYRPLPALQIDAQP